MDKSRGKILSRGKEGLSEKRKRVGLFAVISSPGLHTAAADKSTPDWTGSPAETEYRKKSHGKSHK